MALGLNRVLLKRITIAVLFVVTAAVLTGIFTTASGDKAKAPLSFFVIAVILSAYFGGFWSGATETGLSIAGNPGRRNIFRFSKIVLGRREH